MQFNHPKRKQTSKMSCSVKDMADYVKHNVNINSVADKSKTTKLQNLQIPLTREDCLDAITNQRFITRYRSSLFT